MSRVSFQNSPFLMGDEGVEIGLGSPLPVGRVTFAFQAIRSGLGAVPYLQVPEILRSPALEVGFLPDLDLHS